MIRFALVARQIGALFLASACISGAAHAQDHYPSRPITIVVGYSAGGTNDVLARILAEKMSIMMKQTVIVENKPGVASIVGATYVARSKPDGYTLLMGASGPISFNPALYKSLPYSPDKDLTPVSLLSVYPLVLLTQADNKETATLQGLKAYAAANPQKANYSASAASFQLITELFKKKTGTRFQYIPYKGSIDSITAVSTGDSTMAIVDPGPAKSMVDSGRVRVLAVTSAQRSPFLPNVPTLKESGVDMDVELWTGLFAPAGTPPDVIHVLQRAVRDTLEMPDVRNRIALLLITPKSNTSEEFAAQIAHEITLWKQVAKDAGIQPN